MEGSAAYVMSRAFTKENDGWSYCKEKLESCMYANEYGKCIMSKCVVYDTEHPQEDDDTQEDK